MANLKSFDHQGLHRKIDECMHSLGNFTGDSFETEAEEEEAIDAIDVGVSAAIELVVRGHATAEQEQALFAYLHKYGLL